MTIRPLVLLSSVSAVATSLLLPTSLQAAPSTTSSISITVPDRPDTEQPITRLRLTVDLDSDGPFDLTVTDPEGDSSIVDLVSNTPIPLTGLTFDGTTVLGKFDPPTGTTEFDTLSVATSDAAPGAALQEKRRLTLEFQLQTDYGEDANGNGVCTHEISGAETWTVAVSGANVVGGCLVSFERQDLVDPCPGGPGATLVDTGDAATVSASADIEGVGIQTCGSERPSVDAVLVLDKSGSMNNAHLGSVARPKVEVLEDAVIDLAEGWHDLIGDTLTADALGLIFFDSTAKTPTAASVPVTDGLNPFNTPYGEITDTPGITALTAGGSTSIRAGLSEAASLLAGSDKRKVIVLMTDGKQNTAPLIDADCNLSTGGAIPGCEDLQIHTVTVGAGASIEPAIVQALSTSHGGTYLNTEEIPTAADAAGIPGADAEILRLYFLEILENFMQFNTYQGVVLKRAEVAPNEPFSTTFRIARSAENVVLSAFWPPTEKPTVRIEADPPGERPPLVFRGSGRVSESLPPIAGEWTLRIESRAETPSWVDLKVLEDDHTIHVESRVVPGDFKPNDALVLQARAESAGRPIRKLAEDGVVRVHVLGPDQPLGEMLAEAKIEPQKPDPADPDSTVSAALRALLDEKPELLRRSSNTLELEDDGNDPDETAGDGIYSAQVKAPVAGHYRFLFEIQGPGDSGISFERASIASAYVRATPDPNNSQIVVRPLADQKPRRVIFTPKTAAGHLMGPGWANYFVATVRGKPMKLHDNLDGTYGLEVPVSGQEPVPVQIGFVDDLRIITDEEWQENGVDGTKAVQVGEALLSPEGDGNGEGGGGCPGCACGARDAGGAAASMVLFLGLGLLRRRPR